MTKSTGFARAAVLLAGGLASVGLTTSPAYAQSDPTPYPLPQCIEVKHSTGAWWQTVSIENNCGYALSWMVDREGSNSKCYRLGPYESDDLRWRKIDAYHGTYECLDR